MACDHPDNFVIDAQGKAHWIEGRAPGRRSHRVGDWGADDPDGDEGPGRRGRAMDRDKERAPDVEYDHPDNFVVDAEGKAQWVEGREPGARSHRAGGWDEDADVRSRPGRRGRDARDDPSPDPERDDPDDFYVDPQGKAHWVEGREPGRRSHRGGGDDS